MGHPNEESIQAFFEKHREVAEYYTPKDLVQRALEEHAQWVAGQREAKE